MIGSRSSDKEEGERRGGRNDVRPTSSMCLTCYE